MIANDPYSYSAPGSVWRDHEWLTEIVMAVAYNNFRNEWLGIQLNQCTMGQFSLASKLEDFWMFEITFDANCDASNNLGKIFAYNV